MQKSLRRLRELSALRSGTGVSPVSFSESQGCSETHGRDSRADHPRFLTEWKELLNQRGARADGSMDFPTGEQLVNTDVLVHSAPGTEALDLVLWEAIARAKPVIASRLHGIPEAFIEGEHGLLVPPRRSICVVTTSSDVFTLCPWLPVQSAVWPSREIGCATTVKS